MKSPPQISIKVWGEYACFTRPEMKVERVSYDVMTPSAARGVLKAIYWKPQIRWVIDQIHVKFTVPYGLYRIHGYINPNLAAQTGFDSNGKDLDLFWNALTQMFEADRSASRGEMSPQALIVFRHESALGNAPANKLLDRVTISRNDDSKPARSFSDYTVTVDASNLPDGITIERKI